jgi:hypothetical protein
MMENLLAGIDFSGTLLLNQVMLWMDGGSVTLDLTDRNFLGFTIEFCQMMSLRKYPGASIPGSFLLNEIEVPIRSNEEKIILNALKQIQLSDKLLAEEQRLPKHMATYREIINERIGFVESDKYLTIAKEMGRL